MKYKILYSTILFFLCTSISSKDIKVLSPNGKIEAVIDIEKEVSIRINNAGYPLLEPTLINLTVNDRNLLTDTKLIKVSKQSVNKILTPVVKVKTDQIVENFNELTFSFKNNISLIVRAYNEGIAYRFRTVLKNNIIVNNEELELNFPPEMFAYLMKEPGFGSMSEAPYIPSLVTDYKEDCLFSLPALFKAKNNNFLLITESDLIDYPGMWLTKKNGKLKATLPCKVTATQTEACTSQRFVTERADFLAETNGAREFPWRAFLVADSEKELVTNQMVYLLASPAKEADYSWIEPGMATLDWWGRRNIFHTDFKGGVNTEVHKYFIDFNHKYGLKYFILDDGWSDGCDLKKTNKDLDLNALQQYAEKKNVSLVYWVHAFALAQDVPGNLDFLKTKGAKGIKVDFFGRDDQDVINLIHEISREALKREIVVDYHGICKPIGLIRTYPNILTSEGLIEFEMNGVSDWANPIHHCMLPFIRMPTGPMDYLPGTFNNAQRREFYQSLDRPVGLGTRAHSMALAVLFESPITMLPDSPSDYLNEDECMTFMSKIPVTWDEIKMIDGKIGEYVVIARRKGVNWYLAAITNWDERTIDVNLDFLNNGSYSLEYIEDGINSNVRAVDYKKGHKKVAITSTLSIEMSKGGGWIGIITPQI